MIELKHYDTARRIREQLFVNDAPVDLTNATVRVNWNLQGTALDSTVRTATIIDILNGIVEYSPTPADVAVAGMVDFEWRIVYPGNIRLTIPTRGRSTVKIYPALA